MGRLLAFILGGAALALYVPHLFMTTQQLADWERTLTGWIGEDWYRKVFTYGPGIFAGAALVLFAVRGRESRD